MEAKKLIIGVIGADVHAVGIAILQHAFEEAGFEIASSTYDLHNEMIFETNIETEHEKMFSEQGIKIKALIAKRKDINV